MAYHGSLKTGANVRKREREIKGGRTRNEIKKQNDKEVRKETGGGNKVGGWRPPTGEPCLEKMRLHKPVSTVVLSSLHII
jgi:hypothetical protein